MNSSAHLFAPLPLAGITLPNRIAVSPMCMYSCKDGFANDWHLIHLGSRAVGGAGLVIAEATAVSPEGRISPADLGLWKDEHIAPLARVTEFLHQQGSYAGIQLAHAGRKASMLPPGQPEGIASLDEGGWANVLAPSALRYTERYPMPQALDEAGIARIKTAFCEAARRAAQAGFDVVEIHAAHGYLLHEFLSPLSNHRTDDYGGSFANRVRLLLEVTEAVRSVWPKQLPLFVRISATDWTEGGWSLEESIELARLLGERGVDLIDVSSGGNVSKAQIPVGAGYQTRFAERIRQEAGIKTGTVGLITSAAQAEHILRNEQADMVLLGRELLRDPYWPLHAAEELGATTSWPLQYLRAAGPGTEQRKPVEKKM